jgi:RNA polymerase sigma factor (sigma-70 family)
VLAHVGLARRLARHQHARAAGTGLDLADFEGAAYEGLMQAAQRWDPERARSFGGFAKFRIRGAIQDWMRTTYPASSPRWENDRRRKAGLEKVAQTAVGEGPLVFIGQEERGFRDTESRLTLEAIVAKAPLNHNQRLVLEQRLAGETMKDIGLGLGVTESRVCQIYAEAEQLLREAAA